ncbi:hypothetical protein [Cytophaga sp. FL35]|nr:hypothetical protein [Cytophaga sp. FL35]MBC6996995.1 hypothetical protein [Cytophaga sp. FL35]
MKSFRINEDRPSHHIRKLALTYDVKFEEGVGAPTLKLIDKEIGHG